MKLQDRQTELQKIYRYKGFIKHMFFRPNLSIHTKRVALLAEYICDILELKGVEIDTKYIIALAHMHDDDEFITGDFVSGEKLNFSPEQQKKYEEDCDNAINILVENYGEDFMGYSYRALLEDNNTGESLEYKIVDLADKLDAHCEVCHELFNGNEEFLVESPLPGHGKVPVYNFTHIRTSKRVGIIEKSVGFEISVMKQKVDSSDILGKSIVTSEKDLEHLSSGYEAYDIWIRLQKDNLTQKDISELYTRSNGNVSESSS